MVFELQELAQLDLSQNELTGEVDALFVPALLQVNSSHNNFILVHRYKRFKRSYQTKQICDVAHNSIDEEVVKLMTNLPPNMEQLIL